MMTKELAKAVHMAVDQMAWHALTDVIEDLIHDYHLKLEFARGPEADEYRGGIYALRQFLKTPDNAKAILGKKT